jgi:predicted enzyme related to lactoylglutathione lyase
MKAIAIGFQGLNDTGKVIGVSSYERGEKAGHGDPFFFLPERSLMVHYDIYTNIILFSALKERSYMITRLNMLILMEHDLAAAVSFYENLGLKKVFYLEERWAEFDLNSSKIGLCPVSQAQEPRRTGIVFEVDDIQALYATYKEQGLVVGELIEKIHGIMVSIKDPGNNIIDLYQPTPEKLKDLIQKVKEDDTPQECKKGAACCQKNGNA